MKSNRRLKDGTKITLKIKTKYAKISYNVLKN